MKKRTLIGALVVIASSFFPVSARATLSNDESSCEQDRIALGGRASVVPQLGYRVHVIQAGGDIINEYVSLSGAVFAITWRGVSHPNLQVLLGANYPEFISVAGNLHASRGRAPIGVHTTHAVIMRGGHMRDVHGKAYAPELLPPGFNPESLR